ncbi:MAG: hypothetical protein ACM3NV_03810 [Syntrophothermus sp.]
MRRLAALSLACAAAALAGGCGGAEGVAPGAVVRVYVAAPLCAEARRELRREGQPGEIRVTVACLASELGRHGELGLSAVGADARRATQDSTTVAYLEGPGQASRFAQPIVEEAGIAYVRTRSGSRAMAGVLRAVEEADTGSGSLRDEVRKTLESR